MIPSSPMTTTDDRVILITGGARGIGRAIAEALGGRGWAVAVCYRTSEAEGSSLTAARGGGGARALAVRADVSNPRTAEGLVRQVEAELGRIDALVNCAGPYRRVNVLEETLEGWHAMFDNNLHPLFYLSRAVVPGMKERKWG